MDNIFMDKKLKRTIIMLISIVGLIFFGMVFQIVDIPLPNLPSFVKFQLSSLPAMLGGIAYGPFVGIFIVLAKEFFYFWMTSCSFYELLGVGVTDVIFVVLSSIIYHEMRGGVIKKKNKNGEEYKKIVKRRKKVLLSGLIATAFTTLIGFLFIAYVDMPLLIAHSDLTDESVMYEYVKSYSSINSIQNGVLFVNTPIIMLEYLLSTIFASFIYKPLSNFMHGRFVS